MDKWIHVELPGHGTFWVYESVLGGHRPGPLAPEEHVVDGELNFPQCFMGGSYAHVFPDLIMRYGEQIGVRGDLVPVDRVAVVEAPTLPIQVARIPS